MTAFSSILRPNRWLLKEQCRRQRKRMLIAASRLPAVCGVELSACEVKILARQPDLRMSFE